MRAQVILIHKGGQKHHCTNYRSISLLSPFSKIFEKLIYTRLYSYVEQNKLSSDSQYGFRSGLSTSMAIYDIHENLLKNREEKYTRLLVLYFVIFLKRLIQLTTAYSYTNLNILWN